MKRNLFINSKSYSIIGDTQYLISREKHLEPIIILIFKSFYHGNVLMQGFDKEKVIEIFNSIN